MSDEAVIYKICGQAEWTAAVAQGVYRGSPDDLRDGFIHFSAAEQVRGTAAKWFAGRLDLVLIALDPRSLGPQLRYEASRGGALFPHLYAELPTRHALALYPLPWNGREHVFPVVAQLRVQDG